MHRSSRVALLLLLASLPLQGYATAAMVLCGLQDHAVVAGNSTHEAGTAANHCHDGKAQPKPCTGCAACYLGSSMPPVALILPGDIAREAAPKVMDPDSPPFPTAEGPFRPPRRFPAQAAAL